MHELEYKQKVVENFSFLSWLWDIGIWVIVLPEISMVNLKNILVPGHRFWVIKSVVLKIKCEKGGL